METSIVTFHATFFLGRENSFSIDLFNYAIYGLVSQVVTPPAAAVPRLGQSWVFYPKFQKRKLKDERNGKNREDDTTPCIYHPGLDNQPFAGRELIPFSADTIPTPLTTHY